MNKHLFPMEENDENNKDYFIGSDLLDIFGDSESESPARIEESTQSDDDDDDDEEEEEASNKSNEMEEGEVKLITRVCNKAPRKLQEILTPLVEHNIEETFSDEEDEEDGVIAQPLLLGSAARKTPFFQRKTKEYKLRIYRILLEKRRLDALRNLYHKELTEFTLTSMRISSFLPNPSRCTASLHQISRDHTLTLRTDCINYALLTPLLFKGEIRVEPLSEGGYQCLRIYSGNCVLINIRVKL